MTDLAPAWGSLPEGLPLFDLWIEGTPRPGGSKRAITPRRGDGSLIFRDGAKVKNGRVYGTPIVNVIDQAGEHGKGWRKAIEAAAFQIYRGGPFDGPLAVLFDFHLARPVSTHYLKRKGGDVLRADAPTWPAVAPDTLKLTRAAEDALTGTLWTDDARIVVQLNRKQYAEADMPTGLRVAVWKMPEPDPQQMSLGLEARDDTAG